MPILSTTAAPGEDTALKARIENLPRELYDVIQDLTFEGFVAAGPMVHTLITTVGRIYHESRLKILQLDRITRAQYAETFYTSRAFHVNEYQIITWLQSLPDEHKAFVGTIRHTFYEYYRNGNNGLGAGDFQWREGNREKLLFWVKHCLGPAFPCEKLEARYFVTTGEMLLAEDWRASTDEFLVTANEKVFEGERDSIGLQTALVLYVAR